MKRAEDGCLTRGEIADAKNTFSPNDLIVSDYLFHQVQKDKQKLIDT